jgi:putative intracellular protease/amidase
MGPLSVLQKLGNASSKFSSVKVELLGAEKVVENTAALPFFTDRLFSDNPAEGEGERIVLVPGGIGTLRYAGDKQISGFLKKQNGTVGSICTGSSMLAEAGLLDGKQATSNKMIFDLMCVVTLRSDGPILTPFACSRATYQSSKISYIPSARFVRAGRVWTASGVSAGIDMGFSIASDLFDVAAITTLGKQIGIMPLPSENDPYTEIHSGNWKSYWNAYVVTSIYGFASRFLLQSFIDALRLSPGKKKLAVSILMADTVDTLSLAGSAECFAAAPESLAHQPSS